MRQAIAALIQREAGNVMEEKVPVEVAHEGRVVFPQVPIETSDGPGDPGVFFAATLHAGTQGDLVSRQGLPQPFLHAAHALLRSSPYIEEVINWCSSLQVTTIKKSNIVQKYEYILF